ncbi:SusC/RagA family TonB-linked outer membrane protein [Carboxylicivirga marina]|uniref:SusC/RagA family TonB-linked outer membrane protein n=1 Tax=Carboxylicivirga marina TaxID=2800988 RepID=A0ABS1HI75_9BACT|nr:SusC/RagA family TonB-linked outer membrane protein [Carboxylicivirga marina]MBK3516988.1 SusC/RagA family TonB-linked outer membrane protein [Carboxylicivirga marina]
MKVLFLFLFVVLVCQDANSQTPKLSINQHNATIKQVFNAIMSQSEYTFLYSDADINKLSTVSVNADEISIDKILDICLAKSNLSYKIQDEVIIIRPVTQVEEPQKMVAIRGQVLDDSGLPIPGVNIILKELNTGTVTDNNGKYEMNVPDGKGTLVFSFIGFQKLEEKIRGRDKVNVSLSVSVNDIEGVIVTGYGKRSKESYTGAVSSYSGSDLVKVSSANILSTLQALDPSFEMVENNEIGSDPNIIPEFEIRGEASIPGLEDEFDGSPNMPTFILDGFQVTPQVIFDMDPNRVESITLLKDASATAIYGSKGANGVVVITTKAPEAGKMNVDYKYSLALSAPDLTDYDLLNASEKLQLEKEAGYFNGTSFIDDIEKAKEEYNRKLMFVEKGYDTYWLAKPVQTAMSHKHSTTLGGGNESLRYGLILTYEDNKGVLKGSGRNRYGFAVSLQYVLQNFTFRNISSYSNVVSMNSPYGSFSQYARINPYYRDKDDEGNYLYAFDRIGANQKVYNPLFNTTLNTIDERKIRNFSNNFSIDWQIGQSSIIRGSLALNQQTNNRDKFLPGDHTSFANMKDFSKRGSYIAGSGVSFGYQGNLRYTFSKTIANHLFYLNLGGEIQENSSQDYSIKVIGFPNEKLDAVFFGKEYSVGKPSGSEYSSRALSSIGIFNYAYDSRYLFDVSYRIDGSSRFGANSRWAPFWSIGGGWNVHKETFMKSQSVLSRLKIRGSYGITGSQNFNPYQSLTTYQYYDDTRYHYGYGSTLLGLGNKNLSWQQTVQSNVGIDADFFNGRLSLSGNVYKKLSKDVLTPVTLPTSLGFNTYLENLGQIENKGFDAKVTLVLIKNTSSNVNWTLNFSAVRNINTLKKLSNSLKSINESNDKILDGPDRDENYNPIEVNRPIVRYIEGESANTIWAVRSLGIDPITGKEVYLTKDKQLTNIWNSKDQVPVGTSDAILRGNFGTRLKVKRLELRSIFSYRLGGQQYNSTLVSRVENADKRYNVDRRVFEERWKKPGDITFFKNVADHSQTKPTSRFVEDYSFINITSLSFSYDLTYPAIKKIGVKYMDLTFFMNDLLRISTIKMERGLNYPFARSATFSVRLKM